MAADRASALPVEKRAAAPPAVSANAGVSLLTQGQPRAIASAVPVTIARERSSPVRAWCRSRTSSAIDGGNLGLPANPAASAAAGAW